MTDQEKIRTLHPQGKKGTNILRRRYDTIRTYILELIEEQGEISYQEINDRAVADLSSTFDGKVAWYVVTVKLDLEARGIIERIPKSSPHRLRLRS